MDKRAKLLRSFKGQRTKLLRNIEEELDWAQSLIKNNSSIVTSEEDRQNLIDDFLVILPKFLERFEGLSEQIMQNSEDREDEQLDTVDDLVTNVTVRTTRTTTELSVAKSRIVQEKVQDKEPTDLPQRSASIQQKIDRLIKLQNLLLSSGIVLRPVSMIILVSDRPKV